MNLSEIERRLRNLESRLPQGAQVSMIYGRSEVRPFQVGFPAVLTGPFDPITGYPWAQLVLDVTVPGVETQATPRTGNQAHTVSNNHALGAGVRGWLEIDPQAAGWLFTPELPYARGETDAEQSDVCADGWQDSEIDVTLPVAGTYLLVAQVLVEAGWVTATNPEVDSYYVQGRLYDNTAGVEIPNANAMVARLAWLNSPGNNAWADLRTTYVTTIYAVTQQTDVKLQIRRQPNVNSPGWAAAGTIEVLGGGINVGGNTAITYYQLPAAPAPTPTITGGVVCSGSGGPGSGGGGSGGGGSCCPGGKPHTLTCTVSGATGGATCLPSSFPLTNVSGFAYDSASTLGTCSTAQVILTCINGTWHAQTSDFTIDVLTIVSISCSNGSLMAVVDAVFGSGGLTGTPGTATLTYTSP